MPSATQPKGLVIAAPRSGAGKTTLTLGLLRALKNRGLAVSPLKCGPDYIDPAFHAAAAGRPSFNLDSWAMRTGLIRALVASAGAGADLMIAEGVMGLFDGVATAGQSGRGSTADIAALIGWPVVLLLDTSGQTETAAAVALGLAHYRDDVRVAGVILNRVASPRHRALIEPAFRRIGIPVLGALPRDDAFTLPERHLGLVQASETQGLDDHLDHLAGAIDKAIDLDAVVKLAEPALWADAGPAPAHPIAPPAQRIAIAADTAFSFFYPHVARGWQLAGAELLPFSPLADEAPDAACDAVWLPGGYPELHAGQLAANTGFLEGLRRAAHRGARVHGECGGYMVLGDGLEDAQGHRHAMAGLLALETSFARRLLHLGYRRARLLEACALGDKGMTVMGHEFHYASTRSRGDAPLALCTDANGDAIAEAGGRRGSVSGTFFHAIDVEAA